MDIHITTVNRGVDVTTTSWSVEDTAYTLTAINILANSALAPLQNTIVDIANMQTAMSDVQTDFSNISDLVTLLQQNGTPTGLPADFFSTTYNPNTAALLAMVNSYTTLYSQDSDAPELQDITIYVPEKGGQYAGFSGTSSEVTSFLSAVNQFLPSAPGGASETFSPTTQLSGIQLYALNALQSKIDQATEYYTNSSGGLTQPFANIYSISTDPVMTSAQTVYDDINGVSHFSSTLVQLGLNMPTLSDNEWTFNTAGQEAFTALTGSGGILPTLAEAYAGTQQGSTLSTLATDTSTGETSTQSQIQTTSATMQQASSQSQGYVSMGQQIVSQAADAQGQVVNAYIST